MTTPAGRRATLAEGDALLGGILRDAVVRQPGLVGGEIDLEASWLTLFYDPARLSFQKAEEHALELATALRTRLNGCPAGLKAGVCLETTGASGRISGGGALVLSSAPAEALRGYPSVRRRISLAKAEEEAHELEVSGEVQLGLALTCLGSLLVSMAAERWSPMPAWADWTLAGIAFLSGGALSTANAMRSLARYALDIDSLMVIAAAGAAAIGKWHEGAILLFLFSLSNALEALAMKRTRGAIGALIGLAPQDALVRRAGGETRVPIEQLTPGDLVVIKPGERIPVDGQVREGETEVDAAMLTGESRWVPKGPGEAVFAGTLNQTGVIVVETTRPSAETYLARIITMVEAAQSTKARLHRLIDAFGGVYTPIVLGISVLVFLVLAFGFGQTPFDAFYRSMVLLVVASPCALVLATPSAVLSAIGHGARQGVLFKGGVFVERLGELRAVAFDKTGVLTTGAPRVATVSAFGGSSEERVVAVAASLEQRSTHPLATAVTAAARDRAVTVEPVEGLVATHGLGLTGRLGDGREYWVGNEALAVRRGAAPAGPVREALDAAADRGETVILVGAGAETLGLVTLLDAARAGAKETVAALHAQALAPVVMVTGDHPATARRLSAELGLDEAHAGLLPDEKLKVIRQIGERHGPVAMVGDGVNDGPALAAAHVGITLGMASDVALEVADVVLVSNDLGRLPYAVALARKTRRIVLQNLVIAGGVILCAIPLALAGAVSLPVGVVMHEGSTLVVVANGLRMLRRLRPVG